MEMIKLCSPALFYLVISCISIISIGLQNYNSVNIYCVGSYTCLVTSIGLVFMLKIMYVLFWTWILNLICQSGATSIAWFLVLIPFILFFIILAFMMNIPNAL